MEQMLELYIKHYILSFIYSLEAAYDSSHVIVDDMIIFYYGQEFSNSPHEVVPYQSIVFTGNKSPEEIDKFIRSYQFPGDGSYAIQVFHENVDPQNYKLRYQPLGYSYFLPYILQLAELPTKFDIPEITIQQITHFDQADRLNATLSSFKPFPKNLIKTKNCVAYFAEIDQQPAGWGYLVHQDSHLAYVAGMFTSPEFRQKGVASAILGKMHQYALEKNIHKILLVPSFMAWNFYSKRGYRTIAHFSTFLPSNQMSASKS